MPKVDRFKSFSLEADVVDVDAVEDNDHEFRGDFSSPAEDVVPLICLEGFDDPVDHALFTLGIEADFYNPHAEIITIESQQQDEELKKRLFTSVFLFKPTKPGIFALGNAALKVNNSPEKTIFIINEKDLDGLGDEANEARNVVTMLKGQKVGIFNNMAEAKDHIRKQLTGDLSAQVPTEVVDVDQLKDTV